MGEQVSADKRAEWRRWAEQEFGGDQQAVERATSVVLRFLVEGNSVSVAMEAARAAVADETYEQAPPPHLVSDAHHIRGEVASFRERQELMGNQYGPVWNFRVDRWDAAGEPEESLGIEMRGVSITGSVGNRDWVEIEQSWESGKLVRVKRLRNLTMNTEVLTRESADAQRRVTGAFGALGKTILLLVVLAVFAAVALLMLTQL